MPTVTTDNTYPMHPEGEFNIRVLTAELKSGASPYMLLGFRDQGANADPSTWSGIVSLPSKNSIPTTHLISKLIAACRGLDELPEGVSFDYTVEPLDKVVRAVIKHGVFGAKSKNAGKPKWEIVDFKPCAVELISEDEADKLKAALKVVYADKPDAERPATIAESIRKALKLPEGTTKKVAELNPQEAAVVWAKVEALAESQGATITR